MLEHPWTELQVLIKEKWLTQKAFASILWKKVSEVNELLKWKRNITIQRDYLLHQHLWTPIKYWILKQIDYDYSLLDINEKTSVSHLEKEELGEIWSHSEQSEESTIHHTGILNDSEESREDWKSHKFSPSGENLSEVSQNNASSWTQPATLNVVKIQENTEQVDSSADESASEWQPKPQETQTEPQKAPNQEQKKEIDEDHQKRARIFKSF